MANDRCIDAQRASVRLIPIYAELAHRVDVTEDRQDAVVPDTD